MSSRHVRRPRPHPPFSLRLFVVLMAMLQFVAPTWHICQMGGHVMAMPSGSSSHTMGKLPHYENIPEIKAEEDPNAPQRALICYCPAKPEHQEEPPGPRVSGTASHADHATCLALLLQTMPGTLADPIALVRIGAPVEFFWQAAPDISHTVAFFGRFRGRAPPVNC